MKLARGKSVFVVASAGVAAISLVISGSFLTNSNVLKNLNGSSSQDRQKSSQIEKSVKQALAKLPLAFEPNKGQTAGDVDFVARGPGYVALLTPAETHLKLSGDEGGQGTTLSMQLIGANPNASATSSQRLPGKVNYFKGAGSKGLTNLSTYGKVNYKDVYRGIDMAYYGNQKQLEYDFIVNPGADPAAIGLNFEGADRLALRKDGDLAISAGDELVVQRKPVIYQTISGRRQAVAGSYVVNGKTVGFKIGSYDHTKTLVIDPVIAYRSYLGGAGPDVGFGVTFDSSGAAYVTGSTSPFIPAPPALPPPTNFPTVGTVAGCPGPFPTTSFQCDKGMGDGFVTKMSPDGSAIVWSTYLGGSLEDQGWDVAVDSGGNVYVAGSTESADYPTTATAFDTTCGTDGTCNAPAPGAPGLSDIFLTKLSPNGNKLEYSTYLGGSDVDLDTNPAAGALGDMDIALRGTIAYLTAATGSGDFPTTPTGDQHCGTLGAVVGCNFRNDGFLTLLDTTKAGAAGLVFSTYIGGDGDDQGKGVAIDSEGDAYVAGITFGFPQNPTDPTSPVINNFPSLGTSGVKTGTKIHANGPSGLQPEYGGGASDGFVVKYATSGLAADASAKLNNLKANVSAGAGSLAYATYLGGGGTDEAWDVDVRKNNAFVVGFTESGDDPTTPAADGPAPYFPVTAGAFDTTYNGKAYNPDGTSAFLSGDAFVAKLKSDGNGLDYATFIGSETADVGMGIDVDSAGNAYVTGYTHCEAPVQHIGPIISSMQIGFPTGNGTTRNGAGLTTTYPVHARTTGSNVSLSEPSDLPAGTMVKFTATPDPISGANVLFNYDPLTATGSSTVTVAVDGNGQATTSVTPDPAFPIDPAKGGLSRVKAELVSDPSVVAVGIANWGFPKPSCTSNFPTTAGAPQPVINGDYLGPELHNSPADAFLSKVNPTGSDLTYSTLLGGNDFDRGYAVAVRETLAGNEAYVTGRNGSTGLGTAGSAVPNKPSGKGNRDAYIVKVND